MFQRRMWREIVQAASLTFLSLSAIAENQRPLDLTHAEIIVSHDATPREQQAARMLSEEISKRTQLDMPLSDIPGPGTPVHILLARSAGVPHLLTLMHIKLRSLPTVSSPEGFAIRFSNDRRSLLVVGADERGVLFGIGYLLRHLDMLPGSITTHNLKDLDSSPAYPIRGHQLGYRPKNNTFDGWNAAQFEQYIRDLAIFGTNTIEIIPPHSDDVAESSLFPESPMAMMIKLSSILDRYGLDCSIWYPSLEKDYEDPATVAAAVEEWGSIFDQLPRIDAVFVPGGDPGHTAPKILFAFLEKEAARLRRNHPKAQLWVSPQSFNAQWLEEFYALLKEHPVWLSGVVYGPEMRDTPEEFRRRVPSSYPIRFYPDITHTLSAQYPVPAWDPAFALTEGREPINPRPTDESIIFHRYVPLTSGFVAYSEGSNDDVNKVLWSGWGWNPSASATTLLSEYGRLFISPFLSDQIVSGISGLEENWQGPLLKNRFVPLTLALFRRIDLAKSSAMHDNWRLQQLLYRAYYDAYIQQRTQRETAAQEAAILLLKSKDVSDAVLIAAKRELSTSFACSQNQSCQRVYQLASDLFLSARMQLSVSRYNALAVDRGANLDTIDANLTSTMWLRQRINEALSEPSIMRRSALMQYAVTTLAGPDTGLYDDLGNVERQPHLQRTAGFSRDPSGLNRTYLSVDTSARNSMLPLPLRTFAGTLYDQPLELLYKNLLSTDYAIHLDALEDARSWTVRLNSVAVLPICEEPEACMHPTYLISSSLLKESRLRVNISAAPGLGGNGRSVRVSRIYLSPNQ